MKALVTGAAGFMGTSLVFALIEQGAEVVAFDIALDPASLGSVKDKIA